MTDAAFGGELMNGNATNTLLAALTGWRISIQL